MLTMQQKAVLVDDFLDDDDGSGDEEILQLLFLEEDIPRIENYIENVVHRFNDNTFQKLFRLSRQSCYQLITIFENNPFYTRLRGIGRRGKTAEEHILLSLRFAGDKVSIRTVAELFGMGEATACIAINRVIEFLNNLAPTVIRFPATADERQINANEFLEISNIDGIVGCIDGSYILIRTPVHKISSTYSNRHDETSLTLQAICDARCRFLDCITGFSGKIHDSRIYQKSFIKTKTQQMGRNFHLLGDGAYPLSINLLTPYKDFGNLTPQQENYNIEFSRCRVKIENAFGLLKSRFRQLLRVDMNTVTKISKFVIACCVVHNICIDNKDIDEDYRHYRELYIEPEELIQENIRERQIAVIKRDEIAALLSTTF